MAVSVGTDHYGEWLTIGCDAEGCDCHVSMRPATGPMDLDEALEVAAEWAAEEGWWLLGAAYCARHNPPVLFSDAETPHDGPERAEEAVQPEAAAAAAQRGLTAVH